jgi:hypothetical protein
VEPDHAATARITVNNNRGIHSNWNETTEQVFGSLAEARDYLVQEGFSPLKAGSSWDPGDPNTATDWRKGPYGPQPGEFTWAATLVPMKQPAESEAP